MKNQTKLNEQEEVQDGSFLTKNLQRRSFLRYAGASAAGLALVAAGCKKEKNEGGVNLGSGDTGILNYAYALEQLEAAFYTQVIATQYSGISSTELSLLTDIRDHEIAHREFFKKAIGVSAIQALEVDFSTIDFKSRTSVLNTAKAFEDLGVSAYNGAGALLKSADNLTLAGKIVSVEGRHAALIRDLLSNGTFANDLDANALDIHKLPPAVLSIAGTYIKTKINASNLPTS